MIHTDSSAVKIQIWNCQSAKLADSHTGSQKNLDLIQVSAEMSIVFDIFQKLLLLLWSQGNSFLGIVRNNIQSELKWIPADNILGVSHLKCRFYHTTDTCDGAVGIPVIIKLNKPQLCIWHFDVTNDSLTESFFLYNTHHKSVPCGGIVADTSFQADITLQQLNDSNLSSGIVNSFMTHQFDFILFFTKLHQIHVVNGTTLFIDICVTEFIHSVLSLAFSCT